MKSTRHLLPALLFCSVTLASAPAEAACDDPGGLCVEERDGLVWFPDERLSPKQVTTEWRKNRNRPPSKLILTIEGGRGSLFVDGRYAGTAPIAGAEIRPGRHDLQVRDGDAVLAEGVLTVPRQATDVIVTVRYP